MSHSTRRSSFPVVGMCCVLLGATHPVSADDREKDPIKVLQFERLATLQKMVELTQKSFNEGTASQMKLAETKFALLKAELDVCETTANRMKVLEKTVAVAKQFETFLEEAVKMGSTSPINALAARARRLEAQIALEQEKRGLSP